MTYELRAPTVEDAKQAGEWRNREDIRPTLRTPYMLVGSEQVEFYGRLAAQPHKHRFWSVYDTELPKRPMVAFVGLTNIEWENGHAEISYLSPDGPEEEVLALVLREAFERMRLATVFGECYTINPWFDFWKNAARRSEVIPRRKFWDGGFCDSLFFWFVA